MIFRMALRNLIRRPMQSSGLGCRRRLPGFDHLDMQLSGWCLGVVNG